MSEAEKKIKVLEWYETGELQSDLEDEDDILDGCGRALEKAYAHEILGGSVPMFKGTDGKIYVVTVNATISEAEPDFAEEAIEEFNEQITDNDQFRCEKCRRIFFIENSIKLGGKKGLLYCEQCAEEK